MELSHGGFCPWRGRGTTSDSITYPHRVWFFQFSTTGTVRDEYV